MEYLAGSFVTLLCVVIVNRLLNKTVSKKPIKINVTQSSLYRLMSDLAFGEMKKAEKPKQSSDYAKKNSIRVMFIKDKAYWIKDNQLYTADVVNGEVDKFTTREVDTMTMNEVELENTMFIVEKLTEEL